MSRRQRLRPDQLHFIAFTLLTVARVYSGYFTFSSSTSKTNIPKGADSPL